MNKNCLRKNFTNTIVISPYSLRNPLVAFPQWAERFAVSLAPSDLRGRFYFVNAELGPHVLGLSGTNLDVAYVDEIGERWGGRGAAVVLDMQRLWDDCKWSFDPAIYGTHRFIHAAVGLLTHELAHTLERGELHGSETAETIAPLVQQFLATPYEKTAEFPIPWRDHTAAWLRVVLHLLHRAGGELGFSINHIGPNVTGGGYGLSSLTEYRAALGDEPRRMASEPFATIRATRPPRAFVDIWQRDISRWYNGLSRPTESQTAAWCRGMSLFSRKEIVSMSWLSQVLAIKEQRNAARLETVDELARRHADGETPDPDTVLIACEQAGIDPESYMQKVEHRERRQAWLATVARGPEIERTRAAAEGRLAAAQEKLAAAQREYDRVAGPAQADFAAAGRELGEIEETRRKLREGTQAANIVTRRKDVAAEHGTLRNRLLGLTRRRQLLAREEITPREDRLAGFDAMLITGVTGGKQFEGGVITRGGVDLPTARRLQAELEQARAELVGIEAELPALERKVAELADELVDLDQRAERSPV